MADASKPITFGGKELDPDAERLYAEKIRKAKQEGSIHGFKGKEPVGVVPRPAMPRPVDRAEESPSGLTAEGGVRARPPGSPILSPQTASMLQEAASVAAQQAATKVTEEVKEEKKKDDADLFDMFDFEQRGEAERVLNNKKRRKDIEDRCVPMELEDLILKDEVQQLVPVVPGKFEILYRSMTPDENLFIKSYVAKNDQGKSDQYILEKYGICQITCSVLAINGRPLPDHRDAEGNPDEKAFAVKLKMLLKKSGYVVADLGINYMWFDIRVRKLLNPDAVGNG